MKRWVICKKVLLDGMYEPAISAYTDNFRCWSKDDANWMMCQAGVKNLVPIQDDANCFVLPDISLDLMFSQLSSAQRSAARTALAALGCDSTGMRNTMTIREILHYLARQLQSLANVEEGDVADF